jgi:hypothetical protein
MEPPPVNYLKRYDDEPEPTKFALLRRLIPRCRILCGSRSESMTLLFFGGPSPSLAHRFCLGRSQLLFHFGCCTLCPRRLPPAPRFARGRCGWSLRIRGQGARAREY